jgi:hypothetical protein
VPENPFLDLPSLFVPATDKGSHLGFAFTECSHRLRAYLSIRNGRRQLVGAYVVSIQDRSVFTVEQADMALTAAFDASAAGNPIEFVFAPESSSDAVDFRRPNLHLTLEDMIPGDELDDAGTHDLVHHIPGM